MKVKLLQNGETAEVNASYGTRLITQGKAIPLPEPKVRKVAAPAPPTPQPQQKKPEGDA